jgi:hypothetical protein
MMLEEFNGIIEETIFIFIEYVMNVDACAKLELQFLYKIHLVFRITFEIQLLEMLIIIFMLSSLESWITLSMFSHFKVGTPSVTPTV